MFLLHLCLISIIEILGTDGLFLAGRPIRHPRSVTVQAPVGEITGKLETVTFDGNQYNVTEFLGIPYAEPPVGKNRLKKPIPKAAFIRPFLALDYGATCLQRKSNLTQMVTVSEDCLFLNVFVPGNASILASKLPVMVWIHGGGFVQSTSTGYPGDNLSAFGRVVVVTINYRLAHLGFLRTKENFANFGLWDQHLAIKWVHNNIDAFGGDEGKITIFGESAGSTSVAYQVLYPGNKGLFQRAIAESGGITSEWGYSTEHNADATFTNFTTEMGCSMGSHDSIMSCLRNKTTDEVADVMLNHNLDRASLVPIKDNDFVPMHPQQMINHSTSPSASLDVFYDIDFMMGSCSIDGALYLIYYALNEDIEHFKISRWFFENKFVSWTLGGIFTNVEHIPQLVKDMTNFEYTNWTNPEDDMARNMEFVKLVSDSNMFAPMIAMAQLHAGGSTRPSYMYEFSVAPTTHLIPVPSWLDGPTQANHADDIMFIFGFPAQMLKLYGKKERPILYTDKDIQVAKVVMSMWTNFAKTGLVFKKFEDLTF